MKSIKTPTQYYFDLLEKELKKYEEEIQKKNNQTPAKSK